MENLTKKNTSQELVDSGFDSLGLPLGKLSIEDNETDCKQRNSNLQTDSEESQVGFGEGTELCNSAGEKVPSDFTCEISEHNEVLELEEVGKGKVQLPVDDDGDSLLHLTICNGSEEDALEIIECASWNSINAQNKLGQTPLFLAVLVQMRSVIRRLIDLGAEIDYCDENGNTIIHVAAECGLNESLQEIFTRTSHRHLPSFAASLKDLMESRNCEGYTPLILAVRNKRLSSADLLCKIGADIDAMDLKAGFTALHHVVLTGNVSLVYELIERCSPDVNVASYSGVTPLHLATSDNTAPIADILIIFGADTSKETIEGLSWNSFMSNRFISVG